MSISINKLARIGGIFYLIIIAAGIYGEMFVRSELVVSVMPLPQPAILFHHNCFGVQVLQPIC
jgi:hypothetical protein